MKDPLPPGWTWACPNDVAATEKYSLAIGPFGSSLKVIDYRPNGVPLIFVRHIRAARFNNEGPFVTEEKARDLAAHAVRPGDILVTKMGEPPGDSTIYPQGRPLGIITADCIKWSVDPQAGSARFFDYALHAPVVKRQIARITQGVAQRKISLERFKGIKLPCAPLPEQLRIADLLDSLSSRLDAAVASLEAAQKKLKAYRASVLKAAVEGRLVPTEAALARTEKRNFEPADVLLKRILAERRRRWEEAEFAKLTAVGKPPKDDKWKAKYEEPKVPHAVDLPKLPEGWCWTTLEALLSEPLRNGHSARATAHETGVRTFTLSAVTESDFSIRNTKLTVADPGRVEDLWAEPGDIFVERSNTPELVGTAALYEGPPRFAIFPDLLVRVRCVPEMPARYLESVLASPPSRQYFQKSAQGIAGSMPKIDQGTIQALVIPLPPAVEAARLTTEVQRLLSLASAAADEIARDVRRTTRLRQAVLKWAFEGRLVDQDEQDEPAEKLLDRIRARRMTVNTSQPPRRARRAQ